MSLYGTTLNFIRLLTKTRLFNMIDFFVVKKNSEQRLLVLVMFGPSRLIRFFKTGFYLS